jgi:ADP-ribose pyrophosphatase YjhB (NUDIX family)
MVERVVTRGFQRYWRWSRGLTIGAQGLVIDANNRVLLIRHTYRPGWHFPGGGVECNETVETALVRELKEEANVTPSAAPDLFGLYANFRAFPSDHIALYIVRSFDAAPFSPNREIAETGFFDRHALPQGTIAPVTRRLTEVFDGVPRSSTW